MKCRATSSSIDQIEADCAVLSYFEDERPLKGMTGLADWRLCGSLSGYILEDNISGKFGEILYFPVGHRLKVNRAVMIGLGSKKEYSFETYSVTVRKILDTLFKLNICDFTMTLPGLVGTDIDVTLAATRFCEALAIRYREDHAMFSMLNVMIIAMSDQLKKLNPVLNNFEKKIRGELGM